MQKPKIGEPATWLHMLRALTNLTVKESAWLMSSSSVASCCSSLLPLRLNRERFDEVFADIRTMERAAMETMQKK